MFWTPVSGPGAVTLADRTDPQTTATFAQAGTYELDLVATDGELTSRDRVTITVEPDPALPTPAPPVPPVPAALSIPGWIGSPANATTISAPLPITLAAGITLQDGTLDYWPADDPTAVTEVATGLSGRGGDTLTTFDPTLLANGSYVVRLTGTADDGRTLASGILVTVAGTYKPGRVRFSVTDLTVPVTGLPITIGRTYDSLERYAVGDFGYGWNLTLGNPDLEINPQQDVTLTMPNGERVTFYFTPRSYGGLFGALLQPGYTPEAGVYGTLTANGCPIVVAGGGGSRSGYLCFLDRPQYAPTVYTYEDPYGQVFTMAADGTLRTIKDLNGNTLTFSPDGIRSSSGRSVIFDRDAQGRITQITDPAGNVYGYGYDAAGDLKTVVFPKPDPNSDHPVAEYFYSETHPHLYKYAHDPMGRPVAVNTYYTSPANLDGRLKSITEYRDATTVFTTTYVYDLAAKTITTVNPDGGRIIREFAEQTLPHGNATTTNLVRETSDIRVNPQGQVETSTMRYAYDENRNLIAIALPDPITGVAATPATDPIACASRNICYSYDSRGNRTRLTDALGKTTITEYDHFNRPSRITDPLNNVRELHYDAYGNFLSVNDAIGIMGGFTYDSYGNPKTRYFGDDPNKAVTYDYDQFGNVTAEIDPLGNTITYAEYNVLGSPGKITQQADDGFGQPVTTIYNATYNVLGQPTQTSVTDVSGTTFTTYYEYNRNGDMTTVRDLVTGWNKVTDYYYDGRVKEVTDTDATSIQYTYTWRGDIATITDQEGTITHYDYDLAGNLSSMTETWVFGKEPTASYTYDLAGRQVEQTDAKGNTTITVYDAADRPIFEEDPIHGSTHRKEYQFNDAGRIETITAVSDVQLHVTYDARGFPTTTTYAYGTPAAQTLHQQHDGMGHITSRTDLDNKTTTYGYDVAGRLTSVKNHMQQETSYILDGFGNLRRITDANGHITTFTYDGLGRVISKVWNDGSQETFTYAYMQPVDANPANDREITSSTAPTDIYLRVAHKLTDNHVNYRYYNAQGLQVRVNYYDGTIIQVKHTPKGQVQEIKDQHNTMCYSYDDDDYLIEVKQIANDTDCATASAQRQINYTYDRNGNRTTVTIVVGTTTWTVGYAYDALDRLCAVKVGTIPTSCVDTDGTYVYTYEDYVPDPMIARREILTYPNGLVETANYDQHNRMEHLTQEFNHTTLTSYTYDFSPTGNRRMLTELDGSTTTWTYDDAYRLTREVREDATGSSVWDLHFTYDVVGNRLSMHEAVSGAMTTYTYKPNGLDQIDTVTTEDITHTYTYDPRGNVISDGVVTYTYDATDRLTAISAPGYTRSYTYDALGNLFQETADGVTTEYLWDVLSPYGDSVAEIGRSGAVTARYVLAGATVLEQTTTGTTHYLLRDGQGSTRALFDLDSGTISETYLYDAFGGMRAGPTVPQSDYLYTGQQFDSETGLYYLRARFYNPADGRFLSQDTYPVEVGDPTQMNRYTYGANNPVNGFDPSGQLFIERVAIDNQNEEQREAHMKYQAGWTYSSGMDRMALLLESVFSAAVDEFLIATVWSAMRFQQQMINPNFEESNLHKSVMAIGTVYHLDGAKAKGYKPHTILKAVSMNAREDTGLCRWSDISGLVGCKGRRGKPIVLGIVVGLIRAAVRVAWPGSDVIPINKESEVNGKCNGVLNWRSHHAEILVARWACNEFTDYPTPHRMLNISTSTAACSKYDRPGEPCAVTLPKLKTARLPGSLYLFEMTNFWALPRFKE